MNPTPHAWHLAPPKESSMKPTRCFQVLSIIALALVTGCTGTRTSDDKTSAPVRLNETARPEHLSVKVHSASRDGRYTYMELTAKGELRYSGGRDAAQWNAKPVTTLTDAQIDAVWAIISRHNLTKAPDKMFGKAERITYQVSISTGGLSKNFRCMDDKVTGVKELHDLLFEYQADVRYKVQGIGGQGK